MTTDLIARPDPQSVAALVQKLCGDYGERAVTSQSVREHHSHGEGLADSALPDVVVFPHSNDEVAAIVRLCHFARVPVIAFGVGTSLEGHVAALYGGVCMDLSQMNGVLEVNAQDLDCRVQAGVTREQLNAELKGTGLFFPIDPGANATIGGMAATRLYGVPEAIAAAVCQLPDLASAVNTVIAAMQTGIPVARIELLDDVQMDACIRYSKLEGFAAKPTLFFEFHGSPAGVREQSQAMQAISDEFGGSAYQWATQAEDRTRLWKARHAAYYAALALKPGAMGFATDACVPISRLADCILETKVDIEKSGLVAPIVGHVGDGNFHLVVLFDPNDAGQRDRAEGLAKAVSLRAIAMGGTCTGEHGIGWHKLDVLAQEHGEAVDLMRAVKRALDPFNIMNPGKTVPL